MKNGISDQIIKKEYAIYCGDCIDVIKSLPDNSIDFSIFSPPFADLYCYSDNEKDMGNSKNYNEFFLHFDFLIKELNRIIKPIRSPLSW